MSAACDHISMITSSQAFLLGGERGKGLSVTLTEERTYFIPLSLSVTACKNCKIVSFLIYSRGRYSEPTAA